MLGLSASQMPLLYLTNGLPSWFHQAGQIWFPGLQSCKCIQMFGLVPVFLKIQSIIATVYINVYIATVRQCSWQTNTWTLTSGSRFLKTYILVFSIMANRSGLSFAHFMSQTSLRSNLDGSPAAAWFPVMSSEEARTSRSNKVSTPAMSIMARRLRKIIHLMLQLNT